MSTSYDAAGRGAHAGIARTILRPAARAGTLAGAASALILLLPAAAAGNGEVSSANGTGQDAGDAARIESPAGASSQTRYSYTDLGVLGSPAGGSESSAAWAVNDAGIVVGASTTDLFGASHAFLWQDGQLIDLGTLSRSAFAASAAYAINDAGVIVGQTNVDPASEPPHAFRYRDGVMRDVGTGFGPGSFSRAWDNNRTGVIVGERGRTQSSPVRAFLARNDRFRDLGTLGGRSTLPFSVESIAYAINDRGQIVGTALPAQPPLHAFLWIDGAMHDLGTLGGNHEATEAFGINNRGAIVGRSPTATGAIHAFLWRDGVMQDLGTLGGTASAAYGINIRGEIVGGSTTPTSPPFNAGHAFLWRRGSMVDLNDVVPDLPANVVLETARAISDEGWIVGTTCTSFCEPGATAPTHAFLLRPE
jgi:probable HAF family extracellular repeat protein